MSESKEKIANNIFKYLFLILILAFLAIYFSGSAGYYDSSMHKKQIFTQEMIKKFEEDIAAGKDVSIENYLVDTRKNYNNKVSNLGYLVSKNVGKYIKKGIEGTFKIINKMVE